MSNSDALSDARRRANELLGHKEAERISAREKERQAQDEKIARLRALRLAKEASDKAAGLATRSSKREPKPA
jgi:hypothetical protein